MKEMLVRKAQLKETVRKEGGKLGIYRLNSGFAIINDEDGRAWIYRYSEIDEFWYPDMFFDTEQEAIEYIQLYIEIKKVPQYTVYDVLDDIYATKEQEYEGNEGL